MSSVNWKKYIKNTVKITFGGVFSIYSRLFGRFQELTIWKSRGTNARFLHIQANPTVQCLLINRIQRMNAINVSLKSKRQQQKLAVHWIADGQLCLCSKTFKAEPGTYPPFESENSAFHRAQKDSSVLWTSTDRSRNRSANQFLL